MKACVMAAAMMVIALVAKGQATIVVVDHSGSETSLSLASDGGVYFTADQMLVMEGGGSAMRSWQLDDLRTLRFSGSVSILNLETASTLAIYPNPATTTLTLEATNDERVRELHFYSIIGEEVLRVSCSPGQPVDISQLAAGTYLVRSEEGVAKLVKIEN